MKKLLLGLGTLAAVAAPVAAVVACGSNDEDSKVKLQHFDTYTAYHSSHVKAPSTSTTGSSAKEINVLAFPSDSAEMKQIKLLLGTNDQEDTLNLIEAAVRTAYDTELSVTGSLAGDKQVSFGQYTSFADKDVTDTSAKKTPVVILQLNNITAAQAAKIIKETKSITPPTSGPVDPKENSANSILAYIKTLV